MEESPNALGAPYADTMKRTHPAFWGAGWAGLFTGSALVVLGINQPTEVGSLSGGYGVMLAASALYLLAGLKVRERLGRRTAPIGTTSAATATGSSARAAAAGRS
jgi:hypothetical protein